MFFVYQISRTSWGSDPIANAGGCIGDNCSYGNLKDEIIHDQIVVGIRDGALSPKLQYNADLTAKAGPQAMAMAFS